ncbi:hypothetical protein AB4Z48_12510 [Cupriavidus sp. 2TAF22]|uniref:hypothetical protein n=1 Tax=unclassified Cupriavidus TaxID=2640874 RepID=UPI003F91D3EB
MNARTLITAAALAATVFAGSAQAAYVNHVVDRAARNTAVQGALARERDARADGAHARVDPYLAGARIAGLDRSGPSADPARQRDTFTDGARTKADPFTDGARA